MTKDIDDQDQNPATDAPHAHYGHSCGVTRRGMIGAALSGAGLIAAATLAAPGDAAAATMATPLPDREAPMTDLKLTYLGGPTYMIEIGNFRIVSDPGFDPQGTERVEGPGHTLTKVMEPPIPVDMIGKIDLVLLSHAQHLDNLDHEGRRLQGLAGLTLTTPASAQMGLEGNVKGLAPWESTEITNAAGQKLKITAMPAVHTSNPDLREVVGEVTGFMLEWAEQTDGAFYVSGDTVWIDEIEEIGRRYKVKNAILHLGAANVPAVGDNFLTMNASDGARTVKTLKLQTAYPAHFEGWRHFTQGSWYIEREFEKEGVADALRLLRPGEAASVAV